MEFLKDECGQGAAEYILLFGGVIIIAIAVLIVYKKYYIERSNLNSAADLSSVRGSVK